MNSPLFLQQLLFFVFSQGSQGFLRWCLFFSNSQIFGPKMWLKFQPVSQKLMYAPSFSYPQGSTANLWAQTKDQLVVMADKTKPFQARNGFIASYFCRATLHEGFITSTAAKMSLIKTRQFSFFWLLYSLPMKLNFSEHTTLSLWSAWILFSYLTINA